MKYVLFDVDGVLLSEERCFDVSALTLWEWYNSPDWMHITNAPISTDVSDAEIGPIRCEYWSQDRLFAWQKEHGINSNWDMSHCHILGVLYFLWKQQTPRTLPITTVTQAMVQAWGREAAGLTVPSNVEVLHWLQGLVPDGATKDELFAMVLNAVVDTLRYADGTELSPADRNAAYQELSLQGSMFTLHAKLFQDWYYGNDAGKEGFLHREVPLASPALIRQLFLDLKAAGYTIGVGTGRSVREIQIPFTSMGWWDVFDPKRLSTADAVAEAERQGLGGSLGKPNPFTYVAAIGGVDPARFATYVENPRSVVSPEDTVYIVGDSIADVLAAKAIDATPIMTLTGLTGRDIQGQFKEMGVPYIIEDISHVREVLLVR